MMRQGLLAEQVVDAILMVSFWLFYGVFSHKDEGSFIHSEGQDGARSRAFKMGEVCFAIDIDEAQCCDPLHCMKTVTCVLILASTNRQAERLHATCFKAR
jgi:hypothetical protein